MSVTSTSLPVSESNNAVLAILVGGLIAGALDLTSAFITYGPGCRGRLRAGCWGEARCTEGRGLMCWGFCCTFLSRARRRRFITG